MGLFSIQLPPGWQFFPDLHGGGVIPPGSQGVLHFHSERVADSAELPNLSRMLAGFVTLHHQPVATDQLRRLSINGSDAFAWQYVDKSEQAVRLWVVGNDAAWVFINFQASPLVAASLESEIDGIVGSLTMAMEE